jgi:hypothetical protein
MSRYWFDWVKGEGRAWFAVFSYRYWGTRIFNVFYGRKCSGRFFLWRE